MAHGYFRPKFISVLYHFSNGSFQFRLIWSHYFSVTSFLVVLISCHFSLWPFQCLLILAQKILVSGYFGCRTFGTGSFRFQVIFGRFISIHGYFGVGTFRSLVFFGLGSYLLRDISALGHFASGSFRIMVVSSTGYFGSGQFLPGYFGLGSFRSLVLVSSARAISVPGVRSIVISAPMHFGPWSF